jgi:hypothetical protein
MLRDRLRVEVFLDVVLMDREGRFVSPASDRCLLTVAAAISVARFVLRPRRSADSLMCSYCRARFALLTPRSGIFQQSSCGPMHAGEMPQRALECLGCL